MAKQKFVLIARGVLAGGTKVPQGVTLIVNPPTSPPQESSFEIEVTDPITNHKMSLTKIKEKYPVKIEPEAEIIKEKKKL